MNDGPDFMVIGAPRSGTTWLYDRLRDHPSISLPRVKELHYFDRNKKYPSPNHLSEDNLVKRAMDSRWLFGALRSCLGSVRRNSWSELKWNIKWYFSDYNDEWYVSLFEDMPEISGDVTPAYSILADEDIKKIARLAPSLKIIYLIRDPIERAWSSYRKDYLRKRISLEEGQIIQYLQSDSVVRRGDYLENIARYSQHFPASQILVGFFDAILYEPESLIEEIVDFLGARTLGIADQPSLRNVSNSSPPADIPSNIRDVLCNDYRKPMRELSELFSGYCTSWQEKWFAPNVESRRCRSTVLLSWVDF